MPDTTPAAAMSRKIFELNLPVETVSLYLLCCGLFDAGSPVSISNLKTIWNGTETALKNNMDTLEKKHIVVKGPVEIENEAVYALTDPDQWKTAT